MSKAYQTMQHDSKLMNTQQPVLHTLLVSVLTAATIDCTPERETRIVRNGLLGKWFLLGICVDMRTQFPHVGKGCNRWPFHKSFWFCIDKILADLNLCRYLSKIKIATGIVFTLCSLNFCWKPFLGLVNKPLELLVRRYQFQV